MPPPPPHHHSCNHRFIATPFSLLLLLLLSTLHHSTSFTFALPHHRAPTKLSLSTSSTTPHTLEPIIALSPNPDSSSHMYNYNNPTHQPSALQNITLQRIKDIAASEFQTPIPVLLQKITTFQKTHGRPLNLFDVIKARAPAMALAGEFKRASPSKGLLTSTPLNAGVQASLYYRSGASVISVLTEPNWFIGGLDDLMDARISTESAAEEMGRERPVILRKDFIVSEYQILEAIANGADTVLLIVAVTPVPLLASLISFARKHGVEPLVEVHADVELEIALNAGAKVIGVNNRNLHTFKMDMETTEQTARELTKRNIKFNHTATATDGDGDGDIALCSLSGMSNSDDVSRFRECGVGMCLIGEALMKSSDPYSAILSLRLDPNDKTTSNAKSDGNGNSGGAYIEGLKIVKVCGITNAQDASAACKSGVNLVGVIFASNSPRKVDIEQGKAIVSSVRDYGERSCRIDLASALNKIDMNDNTVSILSKKSRILSKGSTRPLVVGVFQNQPMSYINDVVNQCGLDLVQLHGDEGYDTIRACSVPVIRVIDMPPTSASAGDTATDTESIAKEIIKAARSEPIALLLDTAVKGPGGGGGTGKMFDHTVVSALQALGLPVIIAGGLTPDNVMDLVKNVGCYGVDTSGGVEGEVKGVKVTGKVEGFVREARKGGEDGSKGF